MASGYIELNKNTLTTDQGIMALNQMFKALFDRIPGDGKTQRIYSGFGSPEGAQTGSVGSVYLRKDGGASTSVYVKESGDDATGWVAK